MKDYSSGTQNSQEEQLNQSATTLDNILLAPVEFVIPEKSKGGRPRKQPGDPKAPYRYKTEEEKNKPKRSYRKSETKSTDQGSKWRDGLFKVKRAEYEAKLRYWLATTAFRCIARKKGESSTLSVVCSCLHGYVGDSMVVPERFIEILSEWNMGGKVFPPWNFDVNCDPEDSWWRVFVVAVLCVFSEIILNRKITSGKKVGEGRLQLFYRALSQIEMLAELLLYGGWQVEERCATEASRTINSKTHKGLQAELAAYLDKLDEYAHYIIRNYYSDVYGKLSVSQRQNVADRIEQVRIKGKIGKTGRTDFSHSEKPNYLYNTPSTPPHTNTVENVASVSPLIGDIAVVAKGTAQSEINNSIPQLLKEVSETISKLSSWVVKQSGELGVKAVPSLPQGFVYPLGSPRFVLTFNTAQVWGDKKALQLEKLNTVPLLPIQDCLTSFTTYGGTWGDGRCCYIPPTTVQYAGFSFRTMQDHEPDKASSEYIRKAFRTYVNREEFREVATGNSFAEVVRLIKSEVLKAHTECYRLMLERGFPYQVEFDMVSKEFRYALGLREKLKSEKNHLEDCLNYASESSEYNRLTSEIEDVKASKDKLTDCLANARAFLKLLSQYRPDDLKMMLPAITVNGPVRIHDEEDDKYGKRRWKPRKNVRKAESDTIRLSGVVSVDLDKIPAEAVESVRMKLAESGLFSIIMRTASGTGFWALARYDRIVFGSDGTGGWDEECGWENAKSAIQCWIAELGLESYMDRSCWDKRRFRFLCYDPDCFFDEKNVCQLQPHPRAACFNRQRYTMESEDGSQITVASPFIREEMKWNDEDVSNEPA